MNSKAKLVSQSHNLRTGEIWLLIESDDQTQDELIKESPVQVYQDRALLEKFDSQDRERIAFWAGVQLTKAHMHRTIGLKFMKHGFNR